MLVSALSVAACQRPNLDSDYVGGAPPSGVIEGAILYVGPRPTCYRDEAGEFERVEGRVVLLLFLADNPPPPSGGATSAENLLIIDADELFGPEDCLPALPSEADLASLVTRSAAFTWPEVALADAESDAGADHVDYQLRGFFDRDEDFNPFFSVTRLATRGDVAGGAFVDTRQEPPQFARIRFGERSTLSNGEVVRGVAVTLAAPVNTELPAFELGLGSTALSSEATLPSTPDAAEREQALFEQAPLIIRLVNPASQTWADTLWAAGMAIDPDPSGFGFFSFPADANRDGVQDLHPTLGSAGVQWSHPIVLLRRARNPVELRAGVPDTVIVASTRPTQTLAQQTFAPSIDILVAPVAAVNLDPSNPACTIPYIAPGSVAETYERIPVDCQELPTGNYDVNVLSGVAGGRAINVREQLRAENPDLPEPALELLTRIRTDNDWVIEGGDYSSQAWSVPNELGCPDPYRPNAVDEAGNPVSVSQVDADPQANCGDPSLGCDASGTFMQCTQGPLGRYAVVDPDGSNAPSSTDSSDGHGVAACQTTVRAATLMPDAVRYMAIPTACCAPVQHLCGLPLCPLRNLAVRSDASGATGIRELSVVGEDFDVDDDGSIVPRCTPFLMPSGCCGS